MMAAADLYALVGAALFVVGLDGLIRRVHLLRKILALNVMGSGVFLVIGALARPGPDGSPDAVPQALVITGIVIAIAATALALALMLRIVAASARAELGSDRTRGRGRD